MLKLPRLLESEPCIEGVHKNIASLPQAQWSTNGRLCLEQTTLFPDLKGALFFTRRCGGLQIGIMSIKSLLETEHKGLIAANGPKFFQQAPRVSRLLLVSNDGSPRFYHQCNSVVKAAEGRLVAVQLPIGSKEFSNLLSTKKEGVVRAALVSHRLPVSKTLLALLGLEVSKFNAGRNPEGVPTVARGVFYTSDALGQ